MTERSWTPAQAGTTHVRDGTLLVSVTVGSGEVTMLVQRMIEHITDGQHPSDINRLLVVTLIRAATAKIRGRIVQQLSRILAEGPSNMALQWQQILLGDAHISAAHSFCNGLVCEDFYKLNILHDFRIIDEEEVPIPRGEAITQVLEGCYAATNPSFYELAEAFSSSCDDSCPIRVVNQLYDFIRSHPFPERWLREKAKIYSGAVPVQDIP